MAVTLVAILSLVAIPSFTNFVKDAQKQVTKERMDTIRKAIVGDSKLVANGQFVQPGYESQVGALPSTLNDLVTICASCSAYNAYTKNGWRGPYLSNITGWNQDAWGQTFTYSSASRTITSRGPDRTASTSDDITVSF